MVARIAPSPISTSVAVGDGLAHAPQPHINQSEQHAPPAAELPSEQDHARIAQLPPPPPPPGEAFAAAVIAGQLAPRPVTTEELRQRLGAAWQPPSSPLRLMDKNA